MLMRCLIEREGTTELNLHGFHYLFKRNYAGHAVCDVNSQMHRNHLLSLGTFIDYTPPTQSEINQEAIEREWAKVEAEWDEAMASIKAKGRRGRKKKLEQ